MCGWVRRWTTSDWWFAMYMHLTCRYWGVIRFCRFRFSHVRCVWLMYWCAQLSVSCRVVNFKRIRVFVKRLSDPFWNITDYVSEHVCRYPSRWIWKITYASPVHAIAKHVALMKLVLHNGWYTLCMWLRCFVWLYELDICNDMYWCPEFVWCIAYRNA